MKKPLVHMCFIKRIGRESIIAGTKKRRSYSQMSFCCYFGWNYQQRSCCFGTEVLSCYLKVNSILLCFLLLFNKRIDRFVRKTTKYILRVLTIFSFTIASMQVAQVLL